MRGFSIARGRIIPADAGSTCASALSAWEEPDHPRGGGEHEVGMLLNGIGEGSSPRMRGALSGVAWLASIEGIIPADAGSTTARLAGRMLNWDHPRGCGEH